MSAKKKSQLLGSLKRSTLSPSSACAYRCSARLGVALCPRKMRSSRWRLARKPLVRSRLAPTRTPQVAFRLNPSVVCPPWVPTTGQRHHRGCTTSRVRMCTSTAQSIRFSHLRVRNLPIPQLTRPPFFPSPRSLPAGVRERQGAARSGSRVKIEADGSARGGSETRT